MIFIEKLKRESVAPSVFFQSGLPIFVQLLRAHLVEKSLIFPGRCWWRHCRSLSGIDRLELVTRRPGNPKKNKEKHVRAWSVHPELNQAEIDESVCGSIVCTQNVAGECGQPSVTIALANQSHHPHKRFIPALLIMWTRALLWYCPNSKFSTIVVVFGAKFQLETNKRWDHTHTILQHNLCI